MKSGGSQMGVFCLGVELTLGGYVTKGDTPSSFVATDRICMYLLVRWDVKQTRAKTGPALQTPLLLIN